MTELRT